jgi:hypothetical protein
LSSNEHCCRQIHRKRKEPSQRLRSVNPKKKKKTCLPSAPSQPWDVHFTATPSLAAPTDKAAITHSQSARVGVCVQRSRTKRRCMWSIVDLRYAPHHQLYRITHPHQLLEQQQQQRPRAMQGLARTPISSLSISARRRSSESRLFFFPFVPRN